MESLAALLGSSSSEDIDGAPTVEKNQTRTFVLGMWESFQPLLASARDVLYNVCTNTHKI